MTARVFVAGAAGGISLLLCTIILNVVLGFNVRFTMTPVPNEREVYSLLKAGVTQPGRYLCNPAPGPDGAFPDNEPVFGITYAGVGHEAAGIGTLLGLAQFFLAPLLGAWMLSRTSDQYRARFGNCVGFFVVIGILAAIVSDLGTFGIGGSPLSLALLFAARTLVTWTLVGLPVAWVMRPARHQAGRAMDGGLR